MKQHFKKLFCVWFFDFPLGNNLSIDYEWNLSGLDSLIDLFGKHKKHILMSHES